MDRRRKRGSDRAATAYHTTKAEREKLRELAQALRARLPDYKIVCDDKIAIAPPRFWAALIYIENHELTIGIFHPGGKGFGEVVKDWKMLAGNISEMPLDEVVALIKGEYKDE
jgi:hypothetical protein